MYFEDNDLSFLYIENRGEKCVVSLQRDYEWSVEYIDGVKFDLGTLFSNMNLDEIVISLQTVYDIVEIIDEIEIDNYL